MTSITHTLSHYKPITKDGLILKKLVTEGFGACPGKGMEVTVHYYSESEDGRFLDNTNVLREPYVFIIGKINVIPGLEIAIKSMQMGEKSVFCISPEYSFFAEEKFKSRHSPPPPRRFANIITGNAKIICRMAGSFSFRCRKITTQAEGCKSPPVS